MIHVVDYGAGNIGSIVNMFKHIGVDCNVISHPDSLIGATKIVLPGVGNFDYGMLNLRKYGMIDILNNKVMLEKTPILGICLGAQLMCNKSEEGNELGLGWFDADVKKFNMVNNYNLKVPHMGWNNVTVEKECGLSKDLLQNSRFYFVHSFYIDSKQSSDVMFKTNYGHDFVSGLNRNNIFACQFHPEKSHKFGMQIFKSFSSL